jgi:hypothetical protein
MLRILRENSLTIVLSLLFLIFLVAQSLTGWFVENSDREDHHQPEVAYTEYLESAHFLEATMENWESEFLQMSAFVILTVFLYQKGSAESKKLEGEEKVDRDPKYRRNKKNAPWPVRKGGILLKLYENSLSLAFLFLFLISLILHAVGGASQFNEERMAHGYSGQLSTAQYMMTSRFWFESFQNWQSEFLAVGAMVVLTIWLRQKGSPESKPVDSPNSQTGSG